MPYIGTGDRDEKGGDPAAELFCICILYSYVYLYLYSIFVFYIYMCIYMCILYLYLEYIEVELESRDPAAELRRRHKSTALLIALNCTLDRFTENFF